MTGGTKEALRINRHLAMAAQQAGIAMGVGSQRAAIEDAGSINSFSIAREEAPDILLFANLGAVQLNYGYTLSECQRAVDMVRADALVLHLNPLQEALQLDGDTNFALLAGKIEAICARIEIPVIVKEVGWGISKRTAKLLSDSGVAAIDVAGAGGTSWSKVEMHRNRDEFSRQLAGSFETWGITTADSIINVREAAPEMLIIASGGIRHGLDITKCLALGASLAGMAGKFLAAANQGSDQVLELIRLTQKQIQLTMFTCGVGKILDLHKKNIFQP
jgi:isopentenyl-diphosphate delta-isomerase